MASTAQFLASSDALQIILHREERQNECCEEQRPSIRPIEEDALHPGNGEADACNYRRSGNGHPCAHEEEPAHMGGIASRLIGGQETAGTLSETQCGGMAEDGDPHPDRCKHSVFRAPHEARHHDLCPVGEDGGGDANREDVERRSRRACANVLKRLKAAPRVQPSVPSFTDPTPRPERSGRPYLSQPPSPLRFRALSETRPGMDTKKGSFLASPRKVARLLMTAHLVASAYNTIRTRHCTMAL